jgi:hypothetical protein
MPELHEILEIIMIVSFGASWPLNVMKSWKARSTRGKSLPFLLLIFFGYIAGIASKFASESYMASFSTKWYVLVFYILNFLMIIITILKVFILQRYYKKVTYQATIRKTE